MRQHFKAGLVIFLVITLVVKWSHSDERIIGGEAVSGEDKPKFMAVFNFHPSNSVKCSSSVISEYWVLTAAHCIVSKSHYVDGNCFQHYKKIKFKIECKQQENGDMKISFPEQDEPTPEVYIDVNNLAVDIADESKKYLVDYIITHKDGYKGGMYGAYGGYDIMLVKLRKPLDKSLKACLPGPNYEIKKPKIGGYGRYRRVPCEVNDHGPSVFQYCKVEPECISNSEIFKEAKCKVQFDHKGKEHTGCIKDHDTPSASDEECIKFKNKERITDKSMLREDINEFVILDEKKKYITKCYRNSPGQYGWCGVTKHTIKGDVHNPDVKDMSVSSDDGWGVCTSYCEDKENVQITGFARVKPVEIIEQQYCDKKLNAIRRNQSPFKVPPKVYCVAYNGTYKTRFYQKSGDNYEDITEDSLHNEMMGREHGWYIRATGSCKGDSGGPLFETNDKEYILLGSTSRGTGSLQNCGGIDNPTHYVRVKDMVDWIVSYVEIDNVCISD